LATTTERMSTKDEYIAYANNNFFKLYYYNTKIHGRTGSNPRGFKQISVLKLGSYYNITGCLSFKVFPMSLISVLVSRYHWSGFG
jgi:hypothetical protein